MELDSVLVEKVGQAIYRKNAEYEPGKRTPTNENILAEAAIRVVFDELGLKEEHREPPAGTSTRVHAQFRYVSDWISVDQLGRPVEQGDAK